MSFVQLTVKEDEKGIKERKKVVGIDLGTTNSLVATVVDGKAKVIEDDKGAKIIPSVVRYGEIEIESENDSVVDFQEDFSGPKILSLRDQPEYENMAMGQASMHVHRKVPYRRPEKKKSVVVGHEALMAQMTYPDEVVSSAKRLMGRSRKDAQGKYHYKYADSEGMAKIIAGGRELSPVEVSSDILKHLVGIAEEKGHLKESGAGGHGAVITVPAYFDDAQRQATKDAAKLAGLDVMRLLNEPTAAALAYGLDTGVQGVYVVYDLGGGTFDVSVLRLSRGVFEVLGTGGDSSLGGDDFDECLVRFAYKKAGKEFPQGTMLRFALQEARSAKEKLSEEKKVTFCASGQDVEISANEFVKAAKTLTDRTLSILEECVDECGAKNDIKGVIMVGGATRMPHIKDAVKKLFPAKLHADIDPDEVVALGAALQADILAGNRPTDDWLLLDVTPLSLGIETMGGLVEKIIPRNSAIPVARAQEFTTHKDGQSGMSIHVVQGERDLVSDCRSLARFSVKNIPPMPAGTARIRVTYRADADGILSVSAREMKTETETGIEVKPSYGLSEGEVADMLSAASEHASEDLGARAIVEARIEAESLLGMIRGALAKDSDVAGDDLPIINSEIEKLDTVIGSDDIDSIRAATRDLDKACEGFAQRRMEKAMKAALEGRKVGEVD